MAVFSRLRSTMTNPVDRAHVEIQQNTQPIPTDVYEALGDERRYRTLLLLMTESLPMNVSEVAHSVAAHELGTSRERVPEEHVERVHIALYHHHLPKLADRDLIDYNETENTVEAVADEIEALIE